MKSVVFTEKAPKPVGPYSQGVRAGDFLFVSGQVSIDPETGEIKEGTIEEQTKLVLQNIKAILESGGSTIADVVKITAILTDMANFSAFNAVYQTFFPSSPPSRVCFEGRLPGGGKLLVEVDAIGYVRTG